MRQILLLDDSNSIQKVVKITFSDLTDTGVRVAKSPQDVDLSSQDNRPDVVIACVNFCKDNPVEYLLSIQKWCASILLLAYSDQDISSFEKAGFTCILRKPFISADLRKQVDSFFTANEKVVDELFKTPSFAPPSLPPLAKEQTKALNNQLTSESAMESSPEITIDISGIERNFSESKPFFNAEVDAAVGFVYDASIGDSLFADTPQANKEDSSIIDLVRETFDVANNKPVSESISIDIGNNSDGLEIENMRVHVKPKIPAINNLQGNDIPNASPVFPNNWKEEVDAAVDDGILKALERAVPARIDMRIEEEFPKFTKKIMDKIDNISVSSLDEFKEKYQLKLEQEVEEIRTQVLNEVVKLRQSLANSLINDVKHQIHDAVNSWMDKNILSIAEAEIKSEIQKLLADA